MAPARKGWFVGRPHTGGIDKLDEEGRVKSMPVEAISEILLNDRLTLLIGNHIDLEKLPPKEAEQLLDIVPIEAFVSYTYSVLFNKRPDQSMMATIRAWQEQGSPRSAIAARLLRLSRFSRSARHPIELDAFIREAYQDILGRPADENGMQTYARQGRRWGGRRRILTALRCSAEGRRTQGGRLERVAAIRRLVKTGKLTGMPCIGGYIAHSLAKKQRLFRIELALSAMLFPGDSAGRGTKLLAMLAQAYDDRMETPQSDHPPEALNLESANKNEIDNWIFQDFIYGTRMKMRVLTGDER